MRGAAAAAAAILNDPADTAKRAAAEPDSESDPASESDEPVAESDEEEEEEEEEEEDPEERERRERERMEHEAEEEAKRREKAAADRAKLDKMAWEAEEEAEEEADKVFRLDPYSDLTPNQLFCNVVRRNILEAYPRLSPKNVNALLSTLWSKTLNLDERRNFTHILAEAKTREMDRLGREKRSKAKKAEEAAAWKETAAAFEEDEDDEEETTTFRRRFRLRRLGLTTLWTGRRSAFVSRMSFTNQFISNAALIFCYRFGDCLGAWLNARGETPDPRCPCSP